MLVLAIAEDFDELFEDRSLAAVAALGEFRRVVKVTKYTAFMLIIAVLRPKHGRTDRTGEMLNVVLAIKRRDVRASKRGPTLETQEIKSAEVISFAKRVLVRRMVGDWEKLRRYNLVTIMTCEALQVICVT